MKCRYLRQSQLICYFLWIINFFLIADKRVSAYKHQKGQTHTQLPTYSTSQRKTDIFQSCTQTITKFVALFSYIFCCKFPAFLVNMYLQIQ